MLMLSNQVLLRESLKSQHITSKLQTATPKTITSTSWLDSTRNIRD